jgi:hypothetical protein
VPHKLEIRVISHVGQIGPGAGEKIIDAQHLVARSKQTIDEMGTEEAGSASDKGSLL